MAQPVRMEVGSHSTRPTVTLPSYTLILGELLCGWTPPPSVAVRFLFCSQVMPGTSRLCLCILHTSTLEPTRQTLTFWNVLVPITWEGRTTELCCYVDSFYLPCNMTTALPCLPLTVPLQTVHYMYLLLVCEHVPSSATRPIDPTLQVGTLPTSYLYITANLNLYRWTHTFPTCLG